MAHETHTSTLTRLKNEELDRLKQFLFHKKFGASRMILFNRALDMVQLLLQSKNSPEYGKKRKTLESKFSYVFTGTRPMSDTVREAFRFAVISTVKEKNFPGAVLAEFDEIVEKLNLVWRSCIDEQGMDDAGIAPRFRPGTVISTDDLNFLLSIAKKTGNKISLGVCISLLRQKGSID